MDDNAPTLRHGHAPATGSECKHFREPNGTFACVCVKCMCTLAWAETESDLHNSRAQHDCGDTFYIGGHAMLSSCANPSCSSKFLYLHQGKLFLLKSTTNEPITSARLDFAGHVDHLHYAWLCDQCSHKFEVALDSEGQIKVRARYDFSGLIVGTVGAVAVELASIIAFAGELCELMA